MSSLQQKVQDLESYIFSLGGKVDKILTSDFVKNWRVAYHSETLNGIYLALCVNTLDPLKRNRIQFFTGILNNKDADIKSLPWADPISTFGGFDASGVSWVPPAGSTVIVSFVNGNRNAPYYFGTTYPVSRGQAPYEWGYEIEEYYNIWYGKRKGYLVGPDDESQLLPPWTSENYNAIDSTQFETFDEDPNAYQKITYPHIYGFKTNNKHTLKFDDGDHKCNERYSRVELFSGRGNWLLFKDDHLNPSGQWAHPQCGQAGDDLSECSTKMVNCSNTVAPDVENLNKGSNPYYKHKEECRLYAGAPTPQNAASALPQSGVQLQSIAGYQLVFDDSVEQPSGNPDWRLDFDFGCTDKFIGKAFLKSVTGHSITMKDIESSKGVRDDGNGIVLETACGIKVELNDHTVGNAGNAEEGEENAQDAACPPNSAGKNRGYKVTTTSNHVFAMIDEGNQQCSPMRMSGGLPIAKASAGKVYIKTGYGLEFVMDDSTSQENTKAQSVQILCPQKDNQEAGPHVFLMQESADAATSDSFTSFVFLRAGGQLNIETYGDSVEVVGSESNPSNKIFSVSDQFVVECKNVYFAADESILHYAKENIYLLAGQDCPDTSVEGQLDPCVAPVIVFKDGLLQISDRVFAAAGSGAQKVQLQMVMGGKSGGSSQTN